MDLQSFLATRLACSPICSFLLGKAQSGDGLNLWSGGLQLQATKKRRLSAHDDTYFTGFRLYTDGNMSAAEAETF
jgi:hypothetical protein